LEAASHPSRSVACHRDAAVPRISGTRTAPSRPGPWCTRPRRRIGPRERRHCASARRPTGRSSSSRAARYPISAPKFDARGGARPTAPSD